MFSNKNILIAQGGGPTNVINMSLVSIIKEEKKLKSSVLGSLNGVRGIINNKFKNLNKISENDLKVISQTPGAALGSTRDKPDNKYCLEIFKVLKKKKINKFYYIGGNDSSDSLRIISEHANKTGYKLQCIHIPKTIDNDVGATESSIGFHTAVDVATQALDNLQSTAASHRRSMILEVMGRDAGHIALNTGIGAGAEEILIPEENMGLERLLESLSRSEKSGKSSSIVVIAEGDKTGKNVFDIAEYIEKNMPNNEVRVSVLGHMQRGGRPTCFDRVLASRMGVQAVESLHAGKSNVMVGLKEDEIILTPLEKAIKGKSEINKDLVRVSDILSL